MDRIHRCLDGELPREALTPAEREQLAALEATLYAVAASRPSGAPPDLASLVQGRLEELSRRRSGWDSRGRALLDWLVTPVQLRVRPIAPLAAAVALLLAVAPPRGEADGEPVAAARVFVQFRLDVPDARAVALAGEFTGWRPAYTLHQTAPGVWSVVVPLEPGVHDYAFVIDGQRWVPDPHAAQVSDGFGGTNSRVSVLIPEAGRRS